MSKQTALQWYIEQCENIKYNPLEKNGYTIAKEKIIKQALQMEREQIIDAYVECYMNHVGNGESILREANSYYKNTYGGQNESNFN